MEKAKTTIGHKHRTYRHQNRREKFTAMDKITGTGKKEVIVI